MTRNTLLNYLISNSADATASNSGRKLVRESNGKYRLVYESEGEIYYQNSATGNGNWLGLMRLSAGNGSNKFPSIAERSGKIHVVWQRKTGTNPYDILFRHYTGSAWETIRTVTGGISSSNDLLPELHSHNQQSSVLFICRFRQQ
jgi:hypothetical protein